VTLAEFFPGGVSGRGTRATYWLRLRKFLRYVYPDCKGGDLPAMEPFAARYLEALKAGERSLLEDLRAAVLEWLRFHDYFPDERTLYHLRKGRKAARAITVDRPLTVMDAQRALAHMDVRARAITLLMISSGCRVGEVLDLEMGRGEYEGDIELNTRPARITVRDSKTGQNRLTFISLEAELALREYLRVRDRYVKAARSRRGTRPDELLFPISYRTYHQVWLLALEKAGLSRLDPRTNHHTLTPHSCRKFFMSRLKASGVPDEVVEVLAGHALNLGGAYARYTEEELAAAYLQGERAVTLSKAAVNEKAEKRIRELEAHVQEVKEAISWQHRGWILQVRKDRGEHLTPEEQQELDEILGFFRQVRAGDIIRG
jgi:integrase